MHRAAVDEVTHILGRAGELARGRPSHGDVDALLAALDGLDPLAFIRLDERSRRWHSGLGAGEIARLRSTLRRGPRHRLWEVLALTSADGHERERAARDVPVRPATLALLAIRSTDWVTQVQAAALARIEPVPGERLIAMLPLLEILTRERARAWALDAIVEARLTDDDLRTAAGDDDLRTRRAAWRRLVARGACDARDLREQAVLDPDVLVRAVAADLIDTRPADDRRALAEILIGDRVGWLAGRALETLIDLDGEGPIVDALTARNATLRRRARDWAAVRGIDARSVYLARLEADPRDEAALVALAEIANALDGDILVGALEDPRPHVKAAALEGLAGIDIDVARRVALVELTAGGGRTSRAAAKVLRQGQLDDTYRPRIAAAALDASAPAGRRLRALALLRQWRWPHLAAILQARASATPPLDDVLQRELDRWIARSRQLARGPHEAERKVIVALLDGLDDGRRNAIEFVLRTTA